MLCFFDGYDAVHHVRLRHGVVRDAGELSAQLGDGAVGLTYLLVGGDGFHGAELSAYLYQRQRQLAQYVQLSHGTGGRQIELLPVLRGEFLRPGVDAGDVFQAQVRLDLLQEVHSLAQTVQQREAGVRR